MSKPITPALERQEQKVKGSLGYMKPCLKTKNPKEAKTVKLTVKIQTKWSNSF